MVNIEQLPAEALEVNGVFLEEEVKGYRTLGVSGRELIGTEINSLAKTGSGGSLVLNSRYPDREIVVNYRLRVETDREFREAFNRLNELMGVGLKAVKFKDEMEYTFYGYFGSVEEVPSGTNFVTGSFTLYCADPLKYKDPVVKKGPKVSYTSASKQLTPPEKVSVTLKQNTPKLTLITGESTISLVGGSFKTGDVVVIDFRNNSIESGGVSLLSKLSLSSDFETFYVVSGQDIYVTESSEIEVTYREARL